MTIKWLSLIKAFAICIGAYAIIGLLSLASARAINIQAGNGTSLLQQSLGGPIPILYTVLSCVSSLTLFFGAGVLYGFFAHRDAAPTSVPSFAMGAAIIGLLLVLLRFVGGPLIGSDPLATMKADQPGLSTATILFIVTCIFGIPLILLSAGGGAMYAMLVRGKRATAIPSDSKGKTDLG